MTAAQIEVCKTCLNRKVGSFEPEAICNLRGNVLAPEEECHYFDLDKKVITNKEIAKKMVRPNDQRAKWAVIMVAVVMALDVISLLSSLMQLDLLNQLNSGLFISDEALTSNDTREQTIGILYIIAFIISGVVFIQWFRRAYYNLQLRTGNCEYSDGWAAGAWFTPIISLFRPYQIMLELWEKTTDFINAKSNANLSKSSALIGVWWLLWIVSNYIGKYIIKYSFSSKTLEDYIDLTVANAIDAFFSILLAVITILMIKAYSKREELLN
jgi:hypothetical protein